MPRDKTENHEKIIVAAYREFLEYGFQEASMRRIASECGMSAPGLYKHFPSKEDMFAALVNPTIDGLFSIYNDIERAYNSELDSQKSFDSSMVWEDKKETMAFMEYIYNHFDEFKLIICKSQGTRYECFTHDIAVLEEEVTMRYMKRLESKGRKLKKVDKKEFHLLVTTNIEAIFQAVIHDFSREEAMHYAETLELFFVPAWRTLFGL